MTDYLTVGEHQIGPGREPFIIAEVSGNHRGDLGRALSIVDAVASAGAHAVKFQTYRPDTITIDVDAPQFRITAEHGLWGGRTLYELYEEAHTPWEWHAPLFARARSHGLLPFSSAFDPTAVDLLEELDAPLYKVASAELVDIPLIERMAATSKPLIISTGMATLAEIDTAVRAASAAGATGIVVLACTAAYPARPEEANLLTVPALRSALGVPVGLSDHTLGIGVSIASVALGAVAIEKHVTLSRDEGGVDAAFSLEPHELALLVSETRAAAASLGPARFGPRPSEAEMMRLRRSLYVVADVQAGDPVTADNVRSIRPAGGLPPGEMSRVAGRTFRKAVRRGTPLTWDVI